VLGGVCGGDQRGDAGGEVPELVGLLACLGDGGGLFAVAAEAGQLLDGALQVAEGGADLVEEGGVVALALGALDGPLELQLREGAEVVVVAAAQEGGDAQEQAYAADRGERSDDDQDRELRPTQREERFVL
jgi:hypothetical protein